MDIDVVETDNPTGTAPFTAAPCPIAWNETFINKVHINYPYRGVDPEEQSLEDFTYRKYLDTLWLPNSVAPLEELIHELRRVHELETKDSSSTSPLFTLVEPILLDSKTIRQKYTVNLLGALQSLEASGEPEIEESMARYSWSLEKDKSQNLLQWLELFWKRDIQIQILLILLLISLPNRPKLKKKRKQPQPPTLEDSLGRLLDTLQTISLDEPEPIETKDGDAEGGWATEYCEKVIAPL
ncbi:hypothetical protein FRC03_002698 [Tulasnella sp. 419]|nr:hypothetical protein FRC03_002698 [Tulasnella sp. 419]